MGKVSHPRLFRFGRRRRVPSRIGAPDTPKGRRNMLRWAMGFLVLALIAALLGFGGLASTSAGIAKTLFIVFLIIAAVTFIFGFLGSRKTP
jgi:uncharacterized membrane protein YtjA (UPF0391 family)